ncbi:MAG: methyltransferase domain-containing protein [Phycisphaerales bacterium]|nr:MAG: methyltransferase domain-containing protein [Phycisphaerales bacterium]
MCSKVGTRPKSYEKTAGGLCCPVCATDEVSVFWEMRDLPLKCNVLCSTREEALAVPRGDIRLAVCHSCGFIYNTLFNASTMQYDAGYENALHFSARFREYAESLARRLIDKYNLRQKDILEIACGDGYFLRLLCELGNNRGIGFDPSYVEDTSKGNTYSNVAIIPDYYGEQYADRKADLICCRHALEHVPDPVGFLRMVRRAMGECRDTAVFFEVPNALFILRDLSVWDIIYEHCSYFSAAALAKCFSRSGFAVEAVTEEYDGQFLSLEAQPVTDRPGGLSAELGNPAEVVREAALFAGRFGEKSQKWADRMEALRRAAERVVVWGAGSKGVTFLNMMKGADLVEYVVDINPRKQGMFAAGTGQRIVSPEFLRDHRPGTVVVTNAIYTDEIRNAFGRIQLSPELVTV